jgi:hypothetical protein
LLFHLPFLAEGECLLEEDGLLGLAVQEIVAGSPAAVAVGVEDGAQAVVAGRKA